MSVSARTLIADALVELNVYRESDTPSTTDAARGLRMANRVLGQWNARKLLVPCWSIQTVAMVAAQASYSVGLTANWNVPRPQRIPRASVIVSNVDIPLHILDAQGWANLADKTATGTDPSCLFYNPTMPTGTAYLWPIPTSTDLIRLFLEGQLTAFADLDTLYDIEPSYEQALLKTLVKEFCGPWRRALTQPILMDYQNAMQIIESNSQNAKPPRISVNDIGGRGGYFDTKTRSWYNE